MAQGKFEIGLIFTPWMLQHLAARLAKGFHLGLLQGVEIANHQGGCQAQIKAVPHAAIGSDQPIVRMQQGVDSLWVGERTVGEYQGTQ